MVKLKSCLQLLVKKWFFPTKFTLLWSIFQSIRIPLCIEHLFIFYPTIGQACCMFSPSLSVNLLSNFEFTSLGHTQLASLQFCARLPAALLLWHWHIWLGHQWQRHFSLSLSLSLSLRTVFHPQLKSAQFRYSHSLTHFSHFAILFPLFSLSRHSSFDLRVNKFWFCIRRSIVHSPCNREKERQANGTDRNRKWERRKWKKELELKCIHTEHTKSS